MPQSRSIKLLLADDHAILRAGLRRLLADMPEIEDIGEAEDGQQVLDMVRDGSWNFVVLDLDMPGPSPLDVLKRVKVDHPELPVLVLSTFPEDRFALRALKAGAAGYVNKHSAAQSLMTAIRVVFDGGMYFSASLTMHLAQGLKSSPVDTINQMLSDREFAVLRAIAKGKQPAEIARELNLSAKTVSTYRMRLMAKLDLHSNVELARYALENGLVT
jgi:two-component system, NarL family, invasion response regulator UvrY